MSNPTTPRGNATCPCGSGLKFKRCCRNKSRDPETCRLCGCKEPDERGKHGEYVTLVSEDGSEEPGVWVCKGCIEKRQPKSDGLGILPLMLLAAGEWGKRR